MQTDSHDTHTPLNTSRSSHILGIKTKLSTAYQIPRGELQPDTAHAGPSVTTQSACVCSVPQSCPTLCDPVDCRPPGSSVHGILQARVLEWVATPSSRGSSQPGLPHCRWILDHLRHQGSPLQTSSDLNVADTMGYIVMLCRGCKPAAAAAVVLKLY